MAKVVAHGCDFCPARQSVSRVRMPYPIKFIARNQDQNLNYQQLLHKFSPRPPCTESQFRSSVGNFVLLAGLACFAADGDCQMSRTQLGRVNLEHTDASQHPDGITVTHVSEARTAVQSADDRPSWAWSSANITYWMDEH